jgi:DNA repair photolyase
MALTKKPVSDIENRIGTTESGEIAYNLDAFDRLYKGNIIITKRLTDKLIEKLIEHIDKIILHLTVTGMGSTRIEPFVPSPQTTLGKLQKLIDGGFPTDHIVLRVDPIVPTIKGLNTATSVLRLFRGLGIKRVRISFLDNYKHVRERFKEIGVELYNGEFHAPLKERLKCLTAIKYCAEECGYETVEACGEPGIDSIPCLSQKDIDILGLTDEIVLEGSKGQRNSCHCPSNKKELLKIKPHKCNNGCLYCYWKDEN